MRGYRVLAIGLTFATASVWVSAQGQPQGHPGYQLPPKAIVDILDAPPPPTVELSPTRDTLAVLERSSMPTIAEVAAPMLRIAGQRINPRTNGPHRAQLFRSLSLQDDRRRRRAQGDAAGAAAAHVDRLLTRRQAFRVHADRRDRHRAVARRHARPARRSRSTPRAAECRRSSTPCEWVGEGASLLCEFVAADRGAAPAEPTVPTGPNVQENRGKCRRRFAPTRTC